MRGARRRPAAAGRRAAVRGRSPTGLGRRLGVGLGVADGLAGGVDDGRSATGEGGDTGVPGAADGAWTAGAQPTAPSAVASAPAPSARRVITTELVRGMSFDEAAARSPEERRVWAETLWRFV